MPPTDILLTSLVISIFCAGLSLISREGNVLHFLRKPFEDKSGWIEFISKPLIMCCTCMASFWGVVIYYSMHGWAWQMIICCICSAFLNTLLIMIIDLLIALIQKLQS